jgi:hypothetical protein
MAWVTHAAIGWAVAPRIRTRRVACSMTARTYIRAPVKVTVSKICRARHIIDYAELPVMPIGLRDRLRHRDFCAREVGIIRTP